MDLDMLRRLLARGSGVVGAVASPKVIHARIVSVGDLVRIVEREHLGSFQYRGQRCGKWPLLPSLTREK